MLTKNLKTQWLSELRNPNNTQHRGGLFELSGRLTSYNDMGATVRNFLNTAPDKINCMCALGCLVKVAHVEHIRKTGCTISPEIPYMSTTKSLLTNQDRRNVIDMNDIEHKSLGEIADWVEANVPTND